MSPESLARSAYAVAPPTLYLASQSPRRRQLLQQAGIACELLLPGPDEDAEALEAERPGERPQDYVVRVTALKLAAARQRLARRGLAPGVVLAADTTVVLRGRILAKPVDATDAARMLQRLSGRTHRVLTAVAAHDGRRRHQALSVSSVRLAPLPPDVIQAYVASGEPFGKAGGYAIQGTLAGWIERVAGSYSGVMGLPLFETVQLLRRCGIRALG
ncbi:MAG: Maf family protein [Aquabacterium sp.]